jgi:hypothetical protein
MILMLVVYFGLLGGLFGLFAWVVQGNSDYEKWNEGLDLDVNMVLTLGDEPIETKDVLRSVWRRIHNSRVRRLFKRSRVRRHSRRVAVAVPQWD